MYSYVYIVIGIIFLGDHLQESQLKLIPESDIHFKFLKCTQCSGRESMYTEHALNKILCIHKVYFAILIPQPIVWAGYNRGVPWAEVLCHAHKHGGKIQTLKKILNTKAQYSILAVPCHKL